MRVPFWDRYVSWSRRWDERQRQIAAGADKSLFKRNARRRNWAMALGGICLLSSLLMSALRDGILTRILGVLMGVSGLAGLVMARWAQAERSTLLKPDPAEPLSILKTPTRAKDGTKN